MQKEIRQTWFFQQSPSEVWEYLTKPELMEQWLMKSDFQPIEGRKFCFTFDAKPGSKYAGVVECQVLEITPFTKLSYSWSGSTRDKTRNFDSTVVWTLVAKDNGTELLLQHHGFTVLEDILAHESGWSSLGKKLVEHLNSIKK
jgi:uncharacterized protein YndB with AHSA1/START domain